jgi:hypothetical protein
MLKSGRMIMMIVCIFVCRHNFIYHLPFTIYLFN